MPRWAAVLLLLAGCATYAQQPSEPVALDVIVDDTNVRGGLLATDFSVTDAGVPIQVESARLVLPSGDSTPLPAIVTDEDELAAAAAADRIVGVYVDEYHLSDDAAFAATRSTLAAFLRESLGPRDLVVVLKPLDSVVSIRLTTDRERAAATVEGASARQNDYTARTSFEQNFIAGSPARIDATRNQIALSALSALAAHFGRFHAGRKTLIVLSNGLTGATSASAGDPPLPPMEAVARTANRARVAVYALRPSVGTSSTQQVAGQGRTSQSDVSADPLAALAQQTTGFAIDGPASAEGGLQRVLRDASRYYLLTLAPAERAADGRFRPVQVEIRRQGLAARARAGYGLRRTDGGAASPRISSLPEGLKIPRRSSPLIRTWFGQAGGADGRTKVSFVWEPAPRVPSGRALLATPARVSIAVTTLDGAQVFAGTSNPAGHEAIVASAAGARLEFDAKPGQLLVQLDVLDAAGKVLDRDVRDLVVGGFPGPLSFGTAAVYRARTIRDLREILNGAADAAPVASRQFSRTEHLVVRLPLLSRSGEPQVTARLRSAFGATLRDLVVTNDNGEDGAAVQVDLSLASLASGGYSIEFSARADGGSAVDRVDFVVTP